MILPPKVIIHLLAVPARKDSTNIIESQYIFIDKHIDITSDRIHIVKKIAPKPQMD